MLVSVLVSGVALACVPSSSDEGDTDEVGDTGDTTGGPAETGLLGCPAGQTCTLVAVSQTVDDRVEVFSVAGPGPTYRGGLELDLKPNPGGDHGGSNLDEPYGLAWVDDALHIVLAHYPSREEGSLLTVPASAVADAIEGALVPSSTWFDADSGTASAGFVMTALGVMEPLSLIAHRDAGEPTGELLIGQFANDLFVPEAAWVNDSALIAVRPGGEPRVADVGCDGAWWLTELDPASGDTVALACDGDEGVVILDVSEVGQGGFAAPHCVADIPFSDKRVRFLAGDGLGGVVVAENPPLFSTVEDARIWWFDGDCQLRDFSPLEGESSWDVRQLIAIPNDVGPRWLLARADTDARGLVVLAGDPGDDTIVECGRVEGLDDAGAWMTADGDPLLPIGLDVADDGLVVGVGPQDYGDAAPGYGTLWWVTLEAAPDPCDADALEVVELSASAPAVDPDEPATWRRAPDVVELFEIRN